ncbi:MAG: peptidoglycan DD-metalloendopeptidase family protein [Tannerella sp.]|jgi:murein DD-endopeptidase MepM/ murein hydrolase activator NlpD|nr:peptidoglycan DD-metalloendopeptidase family protein [Tannerella sp.]
MTKPDRKLNLKDLKVYPVLGKDFGLKYGHIPMGQDSPYLERFINSAQSQTSELIREIHEKQGVKWSISGDRENRIDLYRQNEQIMREGRTVHIGLDIIAPVKTPLFSPLDAEVFHVEYEPGLGNYGWLTVLKSIINDAPYYLLFGHLAQEGLKEVGTLLKAGEIFAYIGDYHENGNWFHHTHLQVLTGRGLTEGWLHKALCTPEQLDSMDGFCPSPLPLVENSCSL